MEIEYYNFNENIDSIEWINSLPKGLLSEKVDLRYNTVTIAKLENGYQIYVAPKDSEMGGDVLMITLDKDFQLKHYEIERIEPFPH